MKPTDTADMIFCLAFAMGTDVGSSGSIALWQASLVIVVLCRLLS